VSKIWNIIIPIGKKEYQTIFSTDTPEILWKVALDHKSNQSEKLYVLFVFSGAGTAYPSGAPEFTPGF
jgi:hypothetical protein